VLNLCKKNGGLYIKLGQGIASMNHVLPPQYNKAFSVLHDQVLCGLWANTSCFPATRLQDGASFSFLMEKEKTPPQAPSVPYAAVQRIFQEDMGKDPSEIFKEFEEEPVACMRGAEACCTCVIQPSIVRAGG
jgi:aarF domain-containing kinase